MLNKVVAFASEEAGQPLVSRCARDDRSSKELAPSLIAPRVRDVYIAINIAEVDVAIVDVSRGCNKALHLGCEIREVILAHRSWGLTLVCWHPPLALPVQHWVGLRLFPCY